ncbi:MAG: [FeFe] hydrogenase, group A [Lachnospiraceae bacterium]|nr:[FeFe] hydrogenase, group A [Lachnospiraceae bacterium]
MVNGFINGISVCVPEGTTVLEAAKTVGVRIPTLCYLKDINEIGACRVCVVEIKGAEKLFAACDTVFAEGMEVFTHTPKAIAARRENVAMILSEHKTACTTCVRGGNCTLQSLANELNITSVGLPVTPAEKDWDDGLPLIRDASKCVRCMRCVSVCEKVQGLGVWEVTGTGARTAIGVRGGKSLSDINCALCGQCVTHCPTGALTARDDTAKLLGRLSPLSDPDVVTVVQIAPAVRAAFGEDLGLSPELATEKRLAAALRRIGFDYVFDTNFSADLTIMEEGSELLERLADREKYAWPMFTSCCPGWVRFLKSEYPDMAANLSTAKSPQQMFGAVTKTYFAGKLGKDPAKIFSVSVMPCLAKKNERALPGMGRDGYSDVDEVLTTRELARLIKAFGIDVASLPEEEFDSPLGSGSGAAVIFGSTGGVTEAALRTCYAIVNGKNPDPDAFRAVRAKANERLEAEVELAGTKIRAAVVSGLAATGKLIEDVRAGRAEYDFVEVMACPGGCAGGGGQPIREGEEPAADRAKVLYRYDGANAVRFSHENPDVQALYAEYFGKPLSEKAHHLLHSDHTADWKMPGIMKK